MAHSLPLAHQPPDNHGRPRPFPPPDIHQGSAQKKPGLYSEKLKTHVTWDNKLRRNVLEITLDKKEDTFVDLGQEPIYRLFRTLGINSEKEVEGYFQKSHSIHVWLVNGINLDRFCKNESIRVTKDIKTGFIRPAGKKEVTVTISGLDFNTPDTFVMGYLAKFGTVVTTAVLYDKYKDGPFRGKYNGERKYQVDFTSSKTAMGTFHIIDGSRVRVYYPGNKKTCGRCHKTVENCVGDAVAKDCEENDGPRVPLVDHMKNLWLAIGFQPKDFNLDTEDETNDAVIKDKPRFSPKIDRPNPSEEDNHKFDGVSIKNFPKETKEAEIIDFLLSKGLPEDFTKDKIEVGSHGNVEVTRISPQTCREIISKIHFAETRQKYFGKPIYCRAIRELTPVKKQDASDVNNSEKVVEEEELAVNKETVESILTEDDEFGGDNDDKVDGFVFDPPVNKLKSKLFKNGGEVSEVDTDTEPPNPADAFRKDSKTPATKAPKRSRATPTGTSETKVEKKSKNK